MLGFGVGIYFKLTWAILIPIFLIVVFVSLKKKLRLPYFKGYFKKILRVYDFRFTLWWYMNLLQRTMATTIPLEQQVIKKYIIFIM
jgi:hypothetical protein